MKQGCLAIELPFGLWPALMLGRMVVLWRPLQIKGGKYWYGVEKPKKKANQTQRGRSAKATPAQKSRLLRLRRNSEWVPSPDNEEAEEENDQ